MRHSPETPRYDPPLQRLELDILREREGFTLRPNLERVQRGGERLCQAKELVERGGWLRSIRRVGLPYLSSVLSVSRHLTSFSNEPTSSASSRTCCT